MNLLPDTVLDISYPLGRFNLVSVANLCSIALSRSVSVDELTSDTLEMFQNLYIGAVGIALTNPVSYTTEILAATSEAQIQALEGTMAKQEVSNENS